MDYEPTIEEIALAWRSVDARRRSRRVTWSAIAYHASVSEATLRRWRSASESPGLDAGLAISRFLGMDPARVWGWMYGDE